MLHLHSLGISSTVTLCKEIWLCFIHPWKYIGLLQSNFFSIISFAYYTNAVNNTTLTNYFNALFIHKFLLLTYQINHKIKGMYPYADLLIDWNWLNCFVNISSYYKKWVRIEWILLLFIKAIWAAIFMVFLCFFLA